MELLTIAEYSKQANISRQSVYKRIKTGKIISIDIRNHKYIVNDATDLEYGVNINTERNINSANNSLKSSYISNLFKIFLIILTTITAILAFNLYFLDLGNKELYLENKELSREILIYREDWKNMLNLNEKYKKEYSKCLTKDDMIRYNKELNLKKN
ncbi:MAG: hypothetical protein DRG78_00155 [Epsilonproteobacteria bacterium]|nr:MAG: hypothetical protein DRG78_00155 [Campylobacterota bacterium]